MSKYKICVYTICKNEVQFVDRWVDSMKDADLLVVCDTGSTDDTVEKLKDRGVSVYSITVDPWRFDVARNVSLDLVPADVDICICMDMDEVYEAGWREKLESVWTEETTRLRYMFTWSFNEDGSRGPTYWHDKIHARQGYRWVHPIHEELQYYGDKEECIINEASIRRNHFPDKTKPRSQYLPLLELSKKENPSDVNTVFWLGREYMYYGQYDNGIATLKEHLALPATTWDEQRCASMRYIAQCCSSKGDLKEAQKWLYRAIAQCPYIREPYVDMARLGYKFSNWPLVYHMAEQTLKIRQKRASYLAEESCWDATIYDLGSIACYWIGLFDRALELVETAVELSPDDTRLKNNLNLIKKKYEHSKGV